MTDKESKSVKNFMSDKAVTALNEGKARASVGSQSIDVGMKIAIPADAVIDSHTRDINGVERTWLYITGTYPELSLSRLLALMPTTEKSLERWGQPQETDDNRPSFAELAKALKDAYQPKSRYIPKWVSEEFGALRGKTLVCTARYNYHVEGFDKDSSANLFKVAPTAAKKNNKK